MKNIFLLLLVVLLVVGTVHAATTTNWSPYLDNTAAHYNQSSTLDTSGSTPWEMWWASGLIGFGLFLLSIRPRTSSMELEVDAIICGISLVPIAFCAYASFNIDRITGYGVTSGLNTNAITGLNTNEYVLMINHTIYSFPIIGILMAALFVAAVLNIFRILAQNQLFKIKTREEEMAAKQKAMLSPQQPPVQ